MNMNMRINCCKAVEARRNNNGNLILFKNRSATSMGFWSWPHETGNAFSFCFGFQLPFPSACFGIIQ